MGENSLRPKKGGQERGPRMQQLMEAENREKLWALDGNPV